MSNRIPKLSPIKQNVEIDILRPTDKKGFTVKGRKETDIAIETKAYDKQKYMIWKHGAGWSFPGNLTKYLAVEGEPITSFIGLDEKEVHATVPEFIKTVWGDDGETLYNNMPEDMRSALEDRRWLATVTVKPSEALTVLGKTTLDDLKIQEMLKESSIEIANDVAQSTVKEGGWAPVLKQLWLVLLGAFGMYFVDHALELF